MAQTTVTAVKTPNADGGAGDEGRTADLDALSSQIDMIRKDVSALTELLGELGSRKAAEADQSIQERLDELRHQAESAGVTARSHADAAQVAARDAVRENPGIALAAATAIGFVAGLITSRK